MLGTGRTVVSVPAHDLRDADIPSSLFEAAHLQQMLLPGDLRRAFDLISTVCKRPLCMTRPEMFTHGVARRWLKDRLGTVRNHICLSDGSAIKVIEGLANHVFLFRLDRHREGVALRNLLAWAPEVLAQLHSQINTFHGAVANGRLIAPPTNLLFPKTESVAAVPEFYEFFINEQSGQNSANRIIDRGPVAAPKLNEFSSVSYIPFTESGAHNPEFSKVLAQKIALAYFNPDQCTLIRLPAPHENSSGLLHQTTVALEALREFGIAIPKVPARNILLVRDDVPESFFDTQNAHVSIMFDESFDFWRYTQSLYKRLYGVTYWLGNDRDKQKAVAQCFAKILGRIRTDGRGSSTATPIVLHWGGGKSVRHGKHGR